MSNLIAGPGETLVARLEEARLLLDDLPDISSDDISLIASCDNFVAAWHGVKQRKDARSLPEHSSGVCPNTALERLRRSSHGPASGSGALSQDHPGSSTPVKVSVTSERWSELDFPDCAPRAAGVIQAARPFEWSAQEEAPSELGDRSPVPSELIFPCIVSSVCVVCGVMQVRWTVKVAVLEGKDQVNRRRLVSPFFDMLVGGKDTSFKLMIFPERSKDKIIGSRKFEESKGRFFIQLKCCSDRDEDDGVQEFCFFAGNQRKKAKAHNFKADGAIMSLREEDGSLTIWKLSDLVAAEDTSFDVGVFKEVLHMHV